MTNTPSNDALEQLLTIINAICAPQGDTTKIGKKNVPCPRFPSYGYRFLKDDEVIQAGDEICGNASHTYIENWQVLSEGVSAIGKTPSSFNLKGLNWHFQRKLELPKGYRQLKTDETIKEGDKFWNRAYSDWEETGDKGRKVPSNMVYIRKEDVKPNNEWRQTLCAGYVVGHKDIENEVYRRKIVNEKLVEQESYSTRNDKIHTYDRLVKLTEATPRFLSRKVMSLLDKVAQLEKENKELKEQNEKLQRSSKETKGPRNPGAGYRLLEKGEVLQGGDEVWGYDCNVWDWLEGVSVGYKVRECSQTNCFYRRKIRVESPGYRFLDDGEVIKKGDDIKFRYCPWCPVNATGGHFVGGDDPYKSYYQYRRPIKE